MITKLIVHITVPVAKVPCRRGVHRGEPPARPGARVAGLLAVAALPSLTASFSAALVVCAVACASGGVIAWATVRTGTEIRPAPRPALVHPCNEPCLAAEPDAA